MPGPTQEKRPSRTRDPIQDDLAAPAPSNAVGNAERLRALGLETTAADAAGTGPQGVDLKTWMNEGLDETASQPLPRELRGYVAIGGGVDQQQGSAFTAMIVQYPSGKRHLHRVGDEIAGYQVAEVGKRFLVLRRADRHDVRLEVSMYPREEDGPSDAPQNTDDLPELDTGIEDYDNADQSQEIEPIALSDTRWNDYVVGSLEWDQELFDRIFPGVDTLDQEELIRQQQDYIQDFHEHKERWYDQHGWEYENPYATE